MFVGSKHRKLKRFLTETKIIGGPEDRINIDVVNKNKIVGIDYSKEIK